MTDIILIQCCSNCIVQALLIHHQSNNIVPTIVNDIVPTTVVRGCSTTLFDPAENDEPLDNNIDLRC